MLQRLTPVALQPPADVRGAGGTHDPAGHFLPTTMPLYEDEFGCLAYTPAKENKDMGQALHFNMNTSTGRNPIIAGAIASKSGGEVKINEVENKELAVDVMPHGMKSGAPSIWLWGRFKGAPMGMEFTCENFLGLCGIRLHVAKLAEKVHHVSYLDGADLIADERTTQRLKGYDALHDARHDDGSMLDVAQEILLNLESVVIGQQLILGEEAPWPLKLMDHIGRKHKGDRIKILTIAGAMIAAEIDRLKLIERQKGK